MTIQLPELVLVFCVNNFQRAIRINTGDEINKYIQLNKYIHSIKLKYRRIRVSVIINRTLYV